MPRPRAGISSPRRAGLRAAVAGGVPTAREVAADHSGAVANRGRIIRKCLNSGRAAPLIHNLSLWTALRGRECILHRGDPSCFKGKRSNHNQAGGCR
jgi:hypothetical protein